MQAAGPAVGVANGGGDGGAVGAAVSPLSPPGLLPTSRQLSFHSAVLLVALAFGCCFLLAWFVSAAVLAIRDLRRGRKR